jgi:hypothetical protein
MPHGSNMPFAPRIWNQNIAPMAIVILSKSPKIYLSMFFILLLNVSTLNV